MLRDVGADPLPHLTAQTVAAIKAVPRTEAEIEARGLSDLLVAELQAADVIVIASPMYNFGMSSTLKAWFDHVLRAGVTFRYTAEGPEGLLKARRGGDRKPRRLLQRGPWRPRSTPGAAHPPLLRFIGLD